MQLALSFVAGLLASTTLAVAAPVVKDNGIRVPLTKRSAMTKPESTELDWSKVDAHLANVKAKYVRNLHNFEQNTGAAHPKEKASSKAKRATGSVPLTDLNGEELWAGTIAYGTPAQSFPIDFDTGSSDTLVNSGTYRPSSSSTSKKTSKTFSTAYGDGTTASGTVYTDTLHIGGLSATNVAIGLATSKFLNDGNGNSGISGMAFPSLATFGSNYPPYFNSLINQGKVSSPEFGFKLATSGSELYLGGADSSKYSGGITWSSVDSSQGFWMTDGSVNGQSISSIIDTGTTVIVAPTDEAQSLFDSLGVQTLNQDGSLYGVYDCDSPPTVTFNYGGKRVTLSDDTVSFGTTNDGSCVLSVVGGDVGIDAWVVGDSFIRNVYTVFDMGNTRVGFANMA